MASVTASLPTRRDRSPVAGVGWAILGSLRIGRRARAAVVAAAVVVLALTLGACGEDAGPEVSSDQINLYIWREYTPPELISAFEDEFGVTAQVSYYENNQDMIEGVESNPGRYDLVIPSDYAVDIMRRKKLLEPIDVNDLPNFEHIEDRFKRPVFDPGPNDARRPGRPEKDKLTVPYAWGTTGLVYNKRRVPRPVRRWEDLFRPEFRGRIVTVDDERVPLGATLLTLGKDFNDASPGDLALAKRKLATISDRWIVNNDIPEDELVSGRALIGLMYNGNGFLAERRSPDLEYVLPEEGPNIYFDNMAIPRDAPHADAAKAFMNFVMEPANQARITERYGYSSVNEGSIKLLRRTQPRVIESSVVTPSLDALSDAVISRDLGDAANARLVEVWRELTGRAGSQGAGEPR
jgi:spermidine/putrescine-binding protein